MGSQDTSLFYKSYSTTLQLAMQDYLRHEAFTDVTLVADGGVIHAHKVVLAALSPYLKDLFAQCPGGGQGAFVILPNVKLSDLAMLVQYMYSGKLVAPSDRMEAIRATAHALRVRGFSHSLEAISLKDKVSSVMGDVADLPSSSSPRVDELSQEEISTGSRKRRKRDRAFPHSVTVPSGLTMIPITKPTSMETSPEECEDESQDIATITGPSVANIKADPLCEYVEEEISEIIDDHDYQEYYSGNPKLDVGDDDNSEPYYEHSDSNDGKRISLRHHSSHDDDPDRDSFENSVYPSTSSDTMQQVSQQDLAECGSFYVFDTSSSHRARQPFTSSQVAELEKEFKANPFQLTRERRLRIAHMCGLTQRQVEIWFQNKRTRSKRLPGEPGYLPPSQAGSESPGGLCPVPGTKSSMHGGSSESAPTIYVLKMN